MSSKEIRAKAREYLSGNWLNACAFSLATALLGQLFSCVISTLSAGAIYAGLANENLGVSALGLVLLSVVGVCIFGPLQVSIYRAFLDISDGDMPTFNTILFGFSAVPGAIIYQILYSIGISIGTILLIVPGIIISFMFCMGPIIFAENPEINFMDAFKKSKDIMDGHKMDYFILMLSFIGWALLAGLLSCIPFIGWIATIPLGAYQTMATVVFYKEISGNASTPEY